MTKPSEGSKELIEILFDWHKWRDYYYSDLKEQVITDDEWRVTRDKIDDKAIAKLEAHVKAEIRKTLERLKEQSKSVHEILAEGDEYHVEKSVPLSAIDNEIKSLEKSDV